MEVNIFFSKDLSTWNLLISLVPLLQFVINPLTQSSWSIFFLHAVGKWYVLTFLLWFSVLSNLQEILWESKRLYICVGITSKRWKRHVLSQQKILHGCEKRRNFNVRIKHLRPWSSSCIMSLSELLTDSTEKRRNMKNLSQINRFVAWNILAFCDHSLIL